MSKAKTFLGMTNNTMNNSPALKVQNFHKSYGKTKAVTGIDLEVPRGQFFGLLGPNGAGKTSLIHAITGIATITEGSIELFGIDVETNYREARKLVGLSPQEFNVDIFARVEKTLDYVAGYFGLTGTKKQARIEEVLQRFDLIDHRKKPFRELSGGLKRRLMLARALVHDPDLVILDEPTAGVDVELRLDLWRYLREINEEGKTIILTSHYLEEIEKLCERVGIIHQGKLIVCEDLETFKKRSGTLEQTYLDLTKRRGS